MREIKFRGSRVDNGEMLYGSLVKSPPDHVAIVIHGTREEGTVTKYFLEFHEVEPSTVGQFTGMKDKNGIDIYEGDIVEWDKEHLGQIEEVRWSDEESAWICHNKKDNGSWLCGVNECSKVIGNIHDNPELLEEGK